MVLGHCDRTDKELQSTFTPTHFRTRKTGIFIPTGKTGSLLYVSTLSRCHINSFSLMYMRRILYHHVGVIFPFVINVPFLMREAQAKLAFTTENNQERG